MSTEERKQARWYWLNFQKGTRKQWQKNRLSAAANLLVGLYNCFDKANNVWTLAPEKSQHVDSILETTSVLLKGWLKIYKQKNHFFLDTIAKHHGQK